MARSGTIGTVIALANTGLFVFGEKLHKNTNRFVTVMTNINANKH
jgi:hypothetical protein